MAAITSAVVPNIVSVVASRNVAGSFSMASLHIIALLLAIAAAVAVFRFEIGMIPMLAATSAAGIAIYMLGLVS